MILDAAAASSKPTALALCLVSSWTRKIAYPRLLEDVVLSTERQMHAFNEALLHAQDSANSCAMVRRLWLPAQHGIELAVGRLTGLVDVAIDPLHLLYSTCGDHHVAGPPDAIPGRTSSGLRLTLLPSVHVADVVLRLRALPHTNPSVLARTTHMSYALHTSDEEIAIVLHFAMDLLPHLPRLTHLAIALPTSPNAWHEWLEMVCGNVLALHRAPLCTLVLVLYETTRAQYTDADFAALAGLRERWPGVCVVDVEGGPEDSISAQAWLEGVRTGDSIWDRAPRCCATAS
ncbi:hypothetical protein PLICRDRAFT_43759 [Plicaturopsis crispa FD-325 SS-3]|nr:hypothetical protein PLICRDRAFT_43759 [Plicaturopsis crispa FD-325 SS-3]